MPLLVGSTLESMVKIASRQQMPVQQLVEIMVQVCRGLQASHDGGLVHRDLKPSNIFITEQKLVKIIDFGVAHLADARSVTGVKGTLQYMAPEQMDMRPATPLSDLFSLGVVCYEALSGRRPFARNTESKIAAAIRNFVPPPVSELNPEVNHALARTIHKAMAKQPWYRFSSAREFSETLQKAFKNEKVERFERTHIQPRIDRAQRAHVEGDHQFAIDILNELESEGHVISGVKLLREQAETALRSRKLQQLLENAHTRFREEEFYLALERLQNTLEIDPQNTEVLGLKSEIEGKLQQKQLENSFQLAQQYLDQQLFSQARNTAEEILENNASDTRARNLLMRIEQAKQELDMAVHEQNRLYKAALLACDRGEIKSAKDLIEQLFELLRRKPVSAGSQQAAKYKSLGQRIDSELEAMEKALFDARRHLEYGKFENALAVCDRFLRNGPNDPTFQALKLEIEEALRAQRSREIADFVRRAETETDLDKKHEILQEAVKRYPAESYFQQALALIQNRRDLVHSIVERAHRCEESTHFGEAISQWEMLRNVSPQYPGIDAELTRLYQRQGEQIREQAINRWVEKIKQHTTAGDYAKSQDVTSAALSEFPGSTRLMELNHAVEQQIARSQQARELLEQCHEFFVEENYDAVLAALKEGQTLAGHNPAIRVALLSVLLDDARILLNQNWKTAQPFVEFAMAVDGSDPVARSLSATLEDHKRKAAVDQYVAEATELQVKGNLLAARSKVEQALSVLPNELRLSQLHNSLTFALSIPDDVQQKSQKNVKRKRRGWLFQADAPVAPKPSKNSRGRLKTLEASAASAKNQEAHALAKEYSRNSAAHSVLTPPNDREVMVNTAGPLLSPKSSSGVQGKMSSRPGMMAGSLLIGIVLVATAGVYSSFKKQAPALKTSASSQHQLRPTATAVHFETNFPAATLTVDGKLAESSTVNLLPGPHRVKVSKDGYESKSETITVPEKLTQQTIALTLIPLNAQIRVNLDLPQGKLIIDSGLPINLKDGSGESLLGTGDHQVKLLDGEKELLSFAASASPNQPVRLSNLSGRLPALFISSLGNSATIYTNSRCQLRLPNGSNRNVAPFGSLISDLAKDNYSVNVQDGATRRSLKIESENRPLITIESVNAYGAVPDGMIIVTANVDGASVFVNNIRLKGVLVKPSRSIKIVPGEYSVKLAKAGFLDTNPQIVNLKVGETKAINFTLIPVQEQSSQQDSQLVVHALPPGTEVLIDQDQVGVSGPDGSLLIKVKPGTHSISFHKAGFEGQTKIQRFESKETVTLEAGTLLTELGMLKVIADPTVFGRITVRGEDESQSQEIEKNQAVSLRPGRYSVTVRKREFDIRSTQNSWCLW